jgi:hypothetical protein
MPEPIRQEDMFPLLLEADPSEVKGISEGILDTGSYPNLHPYDFEQWLGPKTKRFCLLSNKGYYGREWPTHPWLPWLYDWPFTRSRLGFGGTRFRQA